MNRLLCIFYLILLCSLCACKKSVPKDTESCFDLYLNTFQKDDVIYSSWNDLLWLVLPSENHTFEALTFTEYDTLFFSDLYNALVDELGQPYANRDTLSYPPDSTLLNSVVYALPNNRQIEPRENIYWWRYEDIIVRLFTSPGYEDVQLPSMAIMSFYGCKALEE